MAVFMVLWPYLLATKLSCLQKKIIEHTNRHGAVCVTPAVVACHARPVSKKVADKETILDVPTKFYENTMTVCQF